MGKLVKLRYFLIVIFFILALTPVLLFRAWPYSAVIEKEHQGAQERHLLLARNIAASLEHYRRDIHYLADDLHSNEFADQMDMFFQPIYRTDDMSFAGVEGLIRWHHPKEGLLEPKDFLSVVSALGLERKIDKTALQRSTDILSELAMRGLNPISLSIELDESSHLDALDGRIFWAVDRLREAGIAIELDDFGSTHASVSSLFDLGPRRIKLDSGLVGRISDSSQIASIVKSIIDLAHNFGVEVVGKGVENMKQLSLLRELGCDYVQGYALNMPMTREELTISMSQPKAAQT